MRERKREIYIPYTQKEEEVEVEGFFLDSLQEIFHLLPPFLLALVTHGGNWAPKCVVHRALIRTVNTKDSYNVIAMKQSDTDNIFAMKQFKCTGSSIYIYIYLLYYLKIFCT